MTPLRPVAVAAGIGSPSPRLFHSLATHAHTREAQRRGATFAASFALHSTLAVALALLPVLLGNALPPVLEETIGGRPVVDIRVLPPPPAGDGAVSVKTRPRPQPQPREPAAFTAPIRVPEGVTADQIDLELKPCPECVPGGAGLPTDAKWVGVVDVPEEPREKKATPSGGAVRTGGLIAPPTLLRRVEPQFPELAKTSRVSALVVLEAEVDARGRVQQVRVLSGHPLFDQASIDAVRQWRYQPLLLNGEPTAFIVTVNLAFRLQNR